MMIQVDGGVHTRDERDNIHGPCESLNVEIAVDPGRPETETNHLGTR